jgi:hypothetical protein
VPIGRRSKQGPAAKRTGDGGGHEQDEKHEKKDLRYSRRSPGYGRQAQHCRDERHDQEDQTLAQHVSLSLPNWIVVD